MSARHVRPPSDTGVLLLTLGLLLATALPFVVVSVLSDEVHHEAKLFAQAAAAALALVGLLLSREPGAEGPPAGLPRFAALALGGAVLCALVSALARHATVDPFVALAFLSPAALFLAGAAAFAPRAAPRALSLLGFCGALTGALAFGQRFLHLPRLPLQVPEPRFLATALVGNPGEMAAGLVLPALILWSGALETDGTPRRRLLSALGFLACALGLGAAETITPILAILAGLLVHAVLSPRRRWLPLAVALLVGAGVLAATGTGARVAGKLRELRSGRIGAALTQRDIGLSAGVEMVARYPVLGVGPGSYENAFVPARVAAEQRARRRFIHYSGAAHFENAHCEPLTLAAELGVPAVLLGGAALLALLAALGRTAGSGERDLLLAGLLAFLVLSLGSFPLRMPVAAGPFALVAGLAFRRAGGRLPLASSPGTRRVLLAMGAALLLGLASTRLLSAIYQARGQRVLREAAAATEGKTDLLARAREDLARTVLLRPRSASAWLALGSCDRLGGEPVLAWERTARSFALEERAETDLDLGLLAAERGDLTAAHALFVRAVWLFPLLETSLDADQAPGSVQLDVEEAEARLPAGGAVPALPPEVEALRLTPRFP